MNRKFLIISLIISVFALFSCSEASIEEDLVGKWKQISLGGSHLDGNDVTWTFAANHNLYRSTVSSVDNSEVIDTAQWKVDANLGKDHLIIENLDPTQYDGKHLIHSLGTTMELQRIEFINGHTDGSFFWSEYEKQ
jgi:hypothetical protein